MRSATFLLNKHPYGQHAGDTRISRLLIEVVAAHVPVRGIALWSGPSVPAPIELTCVRKPPVHPGRLLARSLARGRSLIHTRFLSAELVRAIERAPVEILIAEHTYMAEAALHAGRWGPGLLINTHVLESAVLAERAGRRPAQAPLRWEAARTRRDEIRCVGSAAATVCLGEDDFHLLRAAGLRSASRLDLVLPPLERPPRVVGPPVALFVGDRSWAPNADAARALHHAWPRISAHVPQAELVVAGRPRRGERASTLARVRWLGFVDDLDELYSRATVLLVPVSIGGGVRVKILEAAARGIPVVTTRAGAGSIAEYLPIEPVADMGELVERASEFLGDPGRARAAGDDLHEANAELWRSGAVHRGVAQWLERGTRTGHADASPSLGGSAR
jgi:hypothetical protein